MASPQTLAAPLPTRDDRRRARLDARYSQWKLSSLRRVRACGRAVTSNREGFHVAVSGSVADGTRSAGLGGVQSCGSVWSCPVCSAKIQAKRQTEVATALAVARARGWEVAFLTLTMRHKAGHSLNRLWNHLTAAWGSVTTGSGQRAWKHEKELYGIAGYLRLVEVTHGDNGWHVHAHILLFLDPKRSCLLTARELGMLEDPDCEDLWSARGRTYGAGFTDDDIQQLGNSMFLRWRKALNVDGIRPSIRRGVDIRRVRADDKISEYFAKQLYHLKGEGSTAHDVTGSHGKEAKNGNRTPFGILAELVDVARTGLLDESRDASAPSSALEDLELWHTFEHASRGRRQLLWSRGLRADLLPALEDQDDQSVVDEAPGGDTYVHADRHALRYITQRRLIADLLEAAESDDTGWNLRGWLDEVGLEWSPGPPPRTS